MKKILFIISVFLLLFMVSCNKHEHTFSNEWSSDDKYHYHYATCHESITDEKQEHIWDSGKLTKMPTLDAKGEAEYKCTVCGRKKSVELAKFTSIRTKEEDKLDLQDELFKVSLVSDFLLKYEYGVSNIISATRDRDYIIIYYFDNYDDASRYVEDNLEELQSGKMSSISSYVWKITSNRVLIASSEEVVKIVEEWNDIPLGHIHTYSSWKANNDYHYANDVCCDGKSEIKESHVFIISITVKTPTEDSEGLTISKCLICGRVKATIIPPYNNGYSVGIKYIMSGDHSGYFVSGRGTCTDKVITIANKYKGLPVIGITDNAFSGDEIVTDITFPKSLKVIGKHAFDGCKSLKYVRFENESTLTSIGDEALNNCPNLFSLTLPDTLKEVGTNIIGSITLEVLVIVIDDAKVYFENKLNSFFKCNTVRLIDNEGRDITFLELGEDVTVIPENAFRNCNYLRVVVLGSHVTKIERNAFSGCKDLETIRYNGKMEDFKKIEIVGGLSYLGRDLLVSCNDGAMLPNQ